MVKQPPILSPEEEMYEVGELTPTTKRVCAPLWVSNMYGDLVRDILYMGEAITVMIKEWQDPRAIAPDLVRAYEITLTNQHILFAQESASPLHASRTDYLRIRRPVSVK